MTALATLMIAQSVGQTVVGINDIINSGGRKKALELSAQSSKLALDYQSSKAGSVVLKNQIAIDEQLQGLYKEVGMASMQEGFSSVETNYALAREGGITKEQNLSELEDYRTQIKLQKYNVDIEKQQGLVQEKQRVLANLVGIGSSVVQGANAYSQNKSSNSGVGNKVSNSGLTGTSAQPYRSRLLEEQRKIMDSWGNTTGYRP